MMNHLNSVLIEGIVTELEYSEKTEQCTFRIQTNRFHQKAFGELEKHATFWDVVAKGTIAKVASSKKEQSRVRVVGRLDRIEGNAVIIAEHLEFKGAKK